MIKRWIFYLVALLGCMVFMAAYRGWIAWILLAAVVLLPGFSLLVSLLLVFSVKLQLSCPGAVTVGEETVIELLLTSPFPLPPTKCQYDVTHSLTEETFRLRPGELLPTAHCGQLICRSRGVYLYDLLGLFCLRRKLPVQTVLVRPKPVSTEPPRELERHLAHAWQPKYGGGFAEHHELRLYRPGDGLNQIHWKLSAKTGKLIIREAMIPKYGRILLTADLSGLPTEMDRRLGQLLWMGQYFLELGLQYELHALTGDGLQHHRIVTQEDLNGALDALLCSRPATSGSIRDQKTAASWQFHIGGDSDET